MSEPSISQRRVRIGDLLVAKQIITEEQLQTALQEQKKRGQKLGQTLVSLKLISEDQLLNLLSAQMQIPRFDLMQYDVKPETAQLLPESLARRHRAIVLQNKGDSLVVGMTDPSDLFAYDALTKELKQKIKIGIVKEADLLTIFDEVYQNTPEINNIAEQLGRQLSEDGIDLEQLIQTEGIDDAPVVRLLMSLFEEALRLKASDIHIEPDETLLRIRQRIDGVLKEQTMKERHIAPALVLRLKIMAGLDISEKRIPQDGRFNVLVKQHSIDVRLSTMPVQYGESVVMRLLDQTNGILNLEALGMPSSLLKRFRQAIHKPHGLVLITGPTGSGKTTSLYSALRELNQPEKKIVTVEDPVEYRLPRVNQVQVNAKIGLTFANVLRTTLRQDPDIILIGEMRDKETAEIGLRAAMTGHMVLSSLHTNDAVGAAERLIDMGAEGFIVASCLQAVVAQRLIRRVCEHCTSEHEVTQQEQVWLNHIRQTSQATFKEGLGCGRCHYTGYRGRVGVYELLEFDQPMLDALRVGDKQRFNQLAPRSSGYHPMVVHALVLAQKGITTIAEAMRIGSDVLHLSQPEESLVIPESLPKLKSSTVSH